LKIHCAYYPLTALNKGFVAIIVFTFLFLQSLLANTIPSISHLGIDKGLSNNSVRSIYQDHKGYIWFGSFDGLNRYDGYNFKVFRKQLSDSNSLPHNYITAIGEDVKHNLWVGTGQGLSIYSQLTQTFSDALFMPNGSNQKAKITYNINVIAGDKAGNLFLATNDGGLLVVPSGLQTALQTACVKSTNGTCRNDVETLIVDKEQRVWLFVRDIGLCIYNKVTKTIEVVNTHLKHASCMAIDNKNNIWISTGTGLYLYNIKANVVSQFTGKLTATVVNALMFDRQNNMWIGTEGGGINIYNSTTGNMSYIASGDNKNELSGTDMVAIFEDNESRKWVGTLKGGINVIEPRQNIFQTIAHNPLNKNSLVNNFVSAFYEDANKNIWIGTDMGGFSIWNRTGNAFSNYSHIVENDKSLSNNSVPSFVEDKTGNMWIATYGGGINKFNKKRQVFEHYKCVTQTGEEQKYVWLLYVDKSGTLWAATYGSGMLYFFNEQTNAFEPFSQQHVDIYALKQDSNGNLWAGTPHGLAKVNKISKLFQYFDVQKPVRSILEDKKGRLWIGTEGIGIVLFDAKKMTIIKDYTDIDGLCNNSVLNILEDNSGFLWLSTFHGIARFNTDKGTFKNFYQEDGLQSNQFAYNAAYCFSNGEMAFGGIKGFNIFNPTNLTTRSYQPPLLITGLRINNTAVVAGDKYITALENDNIQSLEIPFSQAALSFDFAALEYTAPSKISYAYYLKGWDKTWNYCGNLRTANYTRLSEGSYTLLVKATNAEGVWNTKEIQMKIIVLPPWYRSWWMYVIYLSFLVALIVIYQRYRVNQAKLAFEIKLSKLSAAKERAERVTEQLINNREKEINEKRLSFFTNISHEFRTPLTLIINPLKDILQLQDKTKTTDVTTLNIVYRNARRLLSLVDQLLLFRKTDTNSDTLKITKLNFYRLCNDVYLAFTQQAKTHGIAYYFECNNPNLEIYADREKIEIVLYNLISNALKYTLDGGAVTLRIQETNEHVVLTVSDNGYGIPKAIGDKLFERFYQVQQDNIPTKTGFGIGLFLVKHFVEHHKGEVTYHSTEGKGTSFLVKLLKGKTHFNDKAIFETTVEDNAFLEELLVPQNDDAVATLVDKNGEPEAIITEKKSLLLVDDDEQMLNYLTLIFKDVYTIYQAKNADDGIKLAYQYLPDSIVSDVNMPGISGIDFCKSIKLNTAVSHIPVILLTGETSPDKKLQGIEGGADDYITKPFEKNLLIAKVASLLKNRTSLQHYFYNEITLKDNPLKISEEYKVFLERCIAVVEKHLADEDFNVKKLAAELNVSHSNLYKKVKSISGQSVNAFIRFIRLRKAAELFINTNMNVNEVASEVGFLNPKYFREQFVKLFGSNPSEYIKKYRKVFGKSYHLNEDAYKDLDS
jgi:signal transduction histidine kinase/ligand-binding sensor domain-containing protein/DNA-binding response OmpR family regulator